MLSLSVCDYVIHRGCVWSSEGIPLLFDHKTLSVLSVRMKYWASQGGRGETHRMLGCTNTHEIMYVSILNPKIHLQTVKSPRTRLLSCSWISVRVPEATRSSGWIFNTCNTKTKDTHTHPHRCYRTWAPQYAVWLLLFLVSLICLCLAFQGVRLRFTPSGFGFVRY